jgi:hypothetical protein
MDENYYENVFKPLLSMFAMADDVFTEDDALSDEHKAKIGLGRLYEEWKRCRKKLDPTFEHIPEERPQKWLPKVVRESRRPAQTTSTSSTATKRISAKRTKKSAKRVRK